MFSLLVMPNFASQVELAVEALSSSPPKEVDENEFIDASRLIYDGVRDIRRAVLMNRVLYKFHKNIRYFIGISNALDLLGKIR